MNARTRPADSSGGRLWILLVLVLFLGTAVAATRPATVRAAGGGALVAEPVLPATAAGARELFGASPAEAPGEVWGVGKKSSRDFQQVIAGTQDIIRYTDAGGWESLPEPLEAGGAPISGMEIPEVATAGRTTPGGGVVVATQVGSRATGTAEKLQAFLVRNPGGEFRVVLPPEEFLAEGEELFQFTEQGQGTSIRMAAVEEATGATGAFVVPHLPVGHPVTAILHYDGEEWNREQICLSTTASECEAEPLPEAAEPGLRFKVIAIDAAGPGSAWALAEVEEAGASIPGEGVILLHREEGEWRRVALEGSLGAVYGVGQSEIGGTKVRVKPRAHGQPLTVTSTGVWADATIAVGASETDASVYLDTGVGDPRVGQVTGAWCGQLPSSVSEQITTTFCTGELPSDLPDGEGRSFAWPGAGGTGEEFGSRAITGVGKGAMLLFENGAFTLVPLDGNGGGSAGAAISYPAKEGRGEGGIEGWLGPSYRLTREPIPSGFVSWPVPFRRPLLAVVSQPGAPVGELGTQALAVGESGEVARYTPGIGWQPESLLTGSGARATPNLRAVAWPVPGLAYAVGDEGAMWIWREGTGLWEPDPGAPPNLIRGNFTGIAFDPNEPERGYAVGQQGLLLGYGRSWTQEVLPEALGSEPNITSIAFAGNEAIASCSHCTGGVIVNNGSGWQVEPKAAEALFAAKTVGVAEGFTPAVRLVAGLPDGGAAIATEAGEILEREGAGAPWHVVPGPPLGVPVALQAIREGGQLRAIVSVEANAINAAEAGPGAAELPQTVGQPPPGQAPLLIEPYGLPASGHMVRQTATGWRDEQRQSFPIPPKPTDQTFPIEMDIPKVPDAVLAFLTSPEGSGGWAVGGQTGQLGSGLQPFEEEGLQTAAVMRFGEAAAPPQNASTVQIPVTAGEATFAIGGNAQCADLCADLTGTGIGPDVWLESAVGKAAATPGVRAFLYTGASVPRLKTSTETTQVTRGEFGAEEAAYAQRLGSAAGGLPVYATPAESDLYESSLSLFTQKFAGFDAPLGTSAPALGTYLVEGGEGNRAAGNDSYAFESTSLSGGEPVRVIDLDYTSAPLGPEEQCWLAGQLAAAKAAVPPQPAIVIGSREVGGDVGLAEILVTGSDEACPQARPGAASAYFFDSPEANVASVITSGSASIPTFGSGSLGYLKIPNLAERGGGNGFSTASGFLLASVDTAARNPTTNIAPVTARLIPSIGSLAINALDGTLLRRSQVALFEALARRPEAGFYCSGNEAPEFCTGVKPDSYVEIPASCVNQSVCSTQMSPEYRFSSSRPDIADFVKQDPASSNLRAVYLNAEGKPEPDPTSGLLCAFNSGTTTVSIETGGLSYSVPVTVQKGSVAQPCGTVPRTDLAAPAPTVTPPPLPPAAQPPFKSPPGTLPPPVAPQLPVVQTPVSTPIVTAPTPIPGSHPVPGKIPTPLQIPIFGSNPIIGPIPVIIPPAPPAAAEPAPPTGTSPVTQPAVSPEPEEEEEAAFDLVHHAVAVRHEPRLAAATAAYRYRSEGGGVPWLLYGLPSLVVIAALCSTGIAGRRRRREPEPAFLQSRR
jgi:hypothetical protein